MESFLGRILYMYILQAPNSQKKPRILLNDSVKTISRVQMAGSRSGKRYMYNVKQVTVCSESGDAQGETVESWKERLPEILDGYSKENMDETGVFWRALPNRGFGVKGKECRGCKKNKQRITVFFVFLFLLLVQKRRNP